MPLAFRFIIKLTIYFALFYGSCYSLIALSSSSGYYWDFVAKYNVLEWYRYFLLSASSLLIRIFDFKSVIVGAQLHVKNGIKINMAYTCTGFGIISFWWAFVLAYPQNKKAFFLVLGTSAIVLLNIIRVSLLAVIYSGDKVFLPSVDHHLVFNIIVYIFLLLFMYYWMNIGKLKVNDKLG